VAVEILAFLEKSRNLGDSIEERTKELDRISPGGLFSDVNFSVSHWQF
jgi:hypothetical protein